MKKYIFLLITITALTPKAEAGWEISGSLSANYSGTAVSDNWEGSESNAKNWMVQSDIYADLEEKKSDLSNSLKVEYGESTSEDESFKVTADRIYLESVYSYKVSRYGNPYASFSAETYFRNFFDPGELTEAAGISWDVLKKEEQTLKTRMGGALKQTLSKDEKPKHDTGMQWVTNYSLKIAKNIRYISELNMFTAFDGGADMRWDNSLHVELNRYLTARIGYLALHDYDPDGPSPKFPDDIQHRLTFGIGASFNLF